MNRETSINPIVLDNKEIHIKELNPNRWLLQDFLMALGNSYAMAPNAYNRDKRLYEVQEMEYAPYTFFKNEWYLAKFFDIRDRLVDTIIYYPDSPEDLEKQISEDVWNLMKKGHFTSQK